MTCLRCQHENCKRFGTYGRRRVQRYRCQSCKATFSEPQPKPLGSHTLELSRAKQIIALLVEGMSVRAVSRLTGVHKSTILSLLNTAGSRCRKLFDERVRNIHPRYVQADEIWTFVHTKQAHLDFNAPAEWGDVYVWIALDSETKMVLSYLVGKRDPASAYGFVRDLSERTVGRFQITTDGLRSYIPAIEECFGAEIDFGQLINIYGTPDAQGPEWYKPSKVISIIPTPVKRKPEILAHIYQPRRTQQPVRQNTPSPLHAP